ncbi:MAG: hypothetical protein A2511_15445 [Deltaproteobacteria bacterium RIFOXYD12_FULL_50_9]|nr:MAG: hypothetical protein A2511_15445 [Deltaproteobacteria bacterium RIFOXYD12_FULL_50_9]
MFVFPAKAMFNRVLPKLKIYANAKPSKKVKAMFISQVNEIVWKYKLAAGTINLAPRDGYNEIQVFEISLKVPDLGMEVLSVIDKAIPYPIFFRLRHDDRLKRVAAYKRPAADGTNNWVTEAYFETEWEKATDPITPLPVSLDIKALYEQMLFTLIDLPPRPGETLPALVERVGLIRKHSRELQTLEAKMNKEKQFNRKVELNAQVRNIQTRIQELQ